MKQGMESDEEAQEVVLPKGLFKNSSTWFCYEIYKNPVCWVFSGFWVSLGFKMFKASTDSINDPLGPINACLFSLLCLIFIQNTNIAFIAHLKRRSKYSLKLAQEMVKMNPGFDIEKWDLISSRLNDYFYHNNTWKTPYFFFGGEDAQDLFRENVLKLYLDGSLNGTTSPSEIGSTEHYLQSVNEEFQFDLKENLPELSPDSGLSRESRKNGFFYIFKYLGYGCLCFSQFMEISCPYILQACAMLNLVMGFLSRESPPFYFFTFYQIAAILSHHRIRHKVRYVDRPCKCKVMSVRQAIKFLAVITKVKPGNSLNKWVEVARYMNEYLVDEGVSKPDLEFSDGKHCLEFYKTHFQPLSIGRSHCGYYELERIVKITQLYVS